jgi:hypothetical protein
MLEPCEVKVSCTVLRGERGREAPDLPDPTKQMLGKVLRRCAKMRRSLDPPLVNAFDTVFELMITQPSARTPELETTVGQVPFSAEAKHARDGRPFIALPHNNRIYAHDWGFATNSMGSKRQGRPVDQPLFQTD